MERVSLLKTNRKWFKILLSIDNLNEITVGLYNADNKSRELSDWKILYLVTMINKCLMEKILNISLLDAVWKFGSPYTHKWHKRSIIFISY